VMSPRSAWSAVLTQVAFRMLGLWPPARDYITQMKYKPQPRFTSGFMVPDRRSTRRTIVGRLLPQPKVIAADGRAVLLDDQLGRSFVLLVRTPDPQTTFAALQQPIWNELHALRVALLPADTSPRPFPGGVSVTECDNSFAAALGPDGTNVLVLRPDRYVAACFPLEDAQTVAATLQALLDSYRLVSSRPSTQSPVPHSSV